jgi:hypothetical protein
MNWLQNAARTFCRMSDQRSVWLPWQSWLMLHDPESCMIPTWLADRANQWPITSEMGD